MLFNRFYDAFFVCLCVRVLIQWMNGETKRKLNECGKYDGFYIDYIIFRGGIVSGFMIF